MDEMVHYEVTERVSYVVSRRHTSAYMTSAAVPLGTFETEEEAQRIVGLLQAENRWLNQRIEAARRREVVGPPPMPAVS